VRANKKTLRRKVFERNGVVGPRSAQASLPPRSWRQAQAQICVAGVTGRSRVRRAASIRQASPP
jgi:hypothetical protein